MADELSIPGVDEVNAMVQASFPGSGNQCAEIGAGYAVATRPVSPGELRPGGYVSGPSQFALADAALWYCVFATIGRVEPMALTSELSIRYVRPCVGSTLWARATLLSASRRTIVGSVVVWADDGVDKPTAVAQGAYVLPASGG